MATAALVVAAASALTVFVSIAWTVAGLWAKWRRRRLPAKAGSTAVACLLWAAGVPAGTAPPGAWPPVPAATARHYCQLPYIGFGITK